MRPEQALRWCNCSFHTGSEERERWASNQWQVSAVVRLSTVWQIQDDDQLGETLTEWEDVAAVDTPQPLDLTRHNAHMKRDASRRHRCEWLPEHRCKYGENTEHSLRAAAGPNARSLARVHLAATDLIMADAQHWASSLQQTPQVLQP
jgi:hypothetical protein|eukprot:m.422020 g.422020  ORF g.422020 m.422020 type:complete len:148 (+) comp35846_c0_seq1:865-1308(+)